jgi:hypothetical protein
MDNSETSETTDPTPATLEKPPSDPNAIWCFWWDPSTAAGKYPNSKCDGEAQIYVRIKHTSRLCPLCAPCLQIYIEAQKALSSDTKKSIPGHGEYKECARTPELDQEYRVQPKKAPAAPPVQE